MLGLGEVLDSLAGDDLRTPFGPALLERLRELLVAQNRLAAEVARTVRECELTPAAEHDGLRTMQSWLRGHARLSEAAAARVVRAGRTLAHLPAVAATHAAGAVNPEQVEVLAPVTRPEKLSAAAAQGIDLAEIDRVLAGVAATQPHGHLTQTVRHYLAGLDPDGPEPDPTEERALTLSTHADGSVSFRGELDPVGAEKFQAAVESLVQAGRCAGDTRTRTKAQGDALVQLCDNVLASGTLPFLRRVKPQVAVGIDVGDLVDPGTGPGTADLGFGATISAARARWMACDGSIARVVFGPDGAPLEVGRTHRVVPPHLRRAVEHRDRSCVFAGCGAPTHWCDVHHLVEWAFGGETSLQNSALLCERHHTKVHHGFRVERQHDGRWRTWRPDGTEIRLPEPLAAA